MADKFYSPDGFLIDQSALGNLPFGWRASSKNGCGWIACYNLLRLLGDPRPAAQVCAEVARMTPFFALGGANFFALAAYLELQGHPIAVRFCLPGHPRRLAQSAGGILLYRHKKGQHFATFAPEGDVFHFWNVRYGDPDDRRTLADFFAAQSVLPCGLAVAALTPHEQRRRRVKLARLLQKLPARF